MKVLLVGGIGRMATTYSATAASLGHELIYAETKLPSTPPLVGAVLVVAPVCSHPLREAAARVAGAQRCPIHYLRTASISVVRRALTSLQEASHVHP